MPADIVNGPDQGYQDDRERDLEFAQAERELAFADEQDAKTQDDDRVLLDVQSVNPADPDSDQKSDAGNQI